MLSKIIPLALCGLLLAQYAQADTSDVKLRRTARATDAIEAIIANVQANAKPLRQVCFNSYAGKINDIATELQNVYNECNAIAEEAEQRLEVDTSKQLVKLEQQSRDSRAAQNACDKLKSLMQRIKCLTSEGEKTCQISTIAKEISATNANKLRDIAAEKARCSTEAERIYVTKTVAANKMKEMCLAN